MEISVNNTTECIICGGTESQESLTGADRNQRLGGTFRLVRCVNCGVERIDPIPNLETLKKHYPAQYYPKDSDAILKDNTNPAYQQAKVRIVQKYIKRGRILDVGTGARNLLKYFIDAGWEAVGTEFSEEAAEFARNSWGLDVRVGPIEAQHFEPESFDVITFWHVLEHLSNPKSAIEESRRILKAGGILVVALPNRASLQAKIFGANWYHLDLPRHIYQFTPQSARKLLEGAGLEILEVSHRSEEHNWAGWELSLIPPHREARKKIPGDIRKAWAWLSRILARCEEIIERGGTFTMVARKA